MTAQAHVHSDLDYGSPRRPHEGDRCSVHDGALMTAACSTRRQRPYEATATSTTTPLAMWTFGGGGAYRDERADPHALTSRPPAASATVTLQFGQAYFSGSVIASTAAIGRAASAPTSRPTRCQSTRTTSPSCTCRAVRRRAIRFPRSRRSRSPPRRVDRENGRGHRDLPGSPNCVDFYAGMFQMASADWGGIGGFSTLAKDGTSVVIPANSEPGGPFNLSPGQTLMSVTCFAEP